MPDKRTFNVGTAILFGCCLFSILNTSVSAQTREPGKPRIKDFGSSLKKFKEKRKSASKTNQKNNDNGETVLIKTDLVVSDVLVLDQKGKAVSGLKQSDFAVAEDGATQEIELFSFGENASLPRSIVLIIDYSGNSPSYTRNSLESAKLLVDKLAPQDKMAIVTDGIQLVTDFTDDKELLKIVLEHLKKQNFFSSDGKRGEQYSALLAVLNEVFDHETVRPIVIFQTTGAELFLLKPIEEPLGKIYRERDFSFNDVRAAVEKSRATIYSIIPQIPLVEISKEEQEINIKKMLKITSEIDWAGKKYDRKYVEESLKWYYKEMPADQAALIEISRLSGGYTEFLAKSDDAETAYSSIFSVINNRYIIGYYPNNQTRDGKRRNVKIEVRGHPEYTVLGRKTYFAPEDEK